MWLKYASRPLMTGEQWDVDQTGDLSSFTKPRGFWITDDSEQCWRKWCVGESFSLDSLTHKHEVILDETDILFLGTPRCLDRFTKKYAVMRKLGVDHKYSDVCIDWPAVARKHSGIVITPYIWERRLTHNWYYGWDCASGCIWRGSAIKEVKLLEIDHSVVQEKAAA